jgi:hypothetical protein
VTVAGSAELIANPALQLTHFPPRHLSQLGVAEQSEGVTRQALLASREYPNSHLKHLDSYPTVFWPKSSEMNEFVFNSISQCGTDLPVQTYLNDPFGWTVAIIV